MSTGRRASPRHASVASQSHDSDDDMGMTASTKESRPLSRNAQAQARLRARRKAYVETLEANVKRLQTIVDAIALDPTRAPRTSSSDSSPLLQPPHGSIPREVNSLSIPSYISPPETSSSESISSGSLPVDTVLHHLQADNARLRRERDALQIQINALTSYISRGYTLPPGMAQVTASNTPSSQGGDKMTEPGFSPGPGSDTGTESPGQLPDAAGATPLMHGGAYTQEDINQLLGYGDPNLAFLRYLQNTGSYGGAISSTNPESFAPASSTQASFQSLANSATSGNNVISGLQRDAGPNLGFSSTDR